MGHDTFDIKQYARTARAVVAEGTVMLRNEGGVLPLREGERIALFGRGQFNYYKSGTGSGGMVNTSYVTGIREALEESSFVLNEKLAATYREWLKENPFDAGAGWAGEPWFQKEMPLTGELVQEAAEESDTAVIIIARTAGEDQDNKAEAGSYLLTADEEDMLRLVCGAFRRTVVLLNVGNIIDMKWVERYRPSSALSLAREMAAECTDEKRKAELLQIAANCDVVPAHRPQTYWQAIQTYWFTHLAVTTELNPWDAYSPGHFDQHLGPFYERDVEAGILTRDQALELMECLWVGRTR